MSGEREGEREGEGGGGGHALSLHSDRMSSEGIVSWRRRCWAMMKEGAPGRRLSVVGRWRLLKDQSQSVNRQERRIGG